MPDPVPETVGRIGRVSSACSAGPRRRASRPRDRHGKRIGRAAPEMKEVTGGTFRRHAPDDPFLQMAGKAIDGP